MKLFQFIAILAILMAIISTKIILYSGNALVVHPEWVTGKLLLAAPIMGSISGVKTRNILNRNRLNLKEWNAFNEILLNRIIHLGSMRFDFYLKDNGYLNILFNKNKNSFSGIRLSRDHRFPSIFFHATSDGEFLSKESISDLSLDKAWHEAELVFQSNSLSFLLDGQVIQRFREISLKRQTIGFKSGMNAAMVDNIKVKDVHDNTILCETFRNKQGFWSLLPVNFGIISVIIGLVFIASKMLKRDRKQTFFLIILFQLLAIVVLVLYYSLDYYYWSQQYHYKRSPKWEQAHIYQGGIENKRIKFFRNFLFLHSDHTERSFYNRQSLIRFLEISPCTKYREIDLKIVRNDNGHERITVIGSDRNAILTYLNREPFSSGVSILFLGTSQMWGAGATSESDRIAPRVLDLLSSNYGGKNNFHVINASKRGSNSEDLLRRYKDHLFLFEPDLIVVNLSNNDGYVDAFRKNLESLIQFNRNLKSELLFILEANTIENNYSWLKKKHEAMITVAKENDITWIDLNSHLSNSVFHDSGIMWWDQVHMTSYGQKVAAEFIAREIIDNFDFSNMK
ncbi:MAG: SGNH/GDSL hydrolase family protein [Planctomycetes bacterium]|nr:SGNH/GDSL hydrolase family protein [Planctomycetota bacterium]